MGSVLSAEVTAPRETARDAGDVRRTAHNQRLLAELRAGPPVRLEGDGVLASALDPVLIRGDQRQSTASRERVVERWPGNSSAIGASGAIRRAICAGHGMSAKKQASRNAPLARFRLAVASLFRSCPDAARRCQSPLGYEPYNARLPVSGVPKRSR